MSPRAGVQPSTRSALGAGVATARYSDRVQLGTKFTSTRVHECLHIVKCAKPRPGGKNLDAPAEINSKIRG
eukprot:SAG31_NODE_104_length_25069_cov_12.917144_8_plen_71_part_00